MENKSRAALAALEPKISRELIEKWLEKNAPLCTCDEAYTGRGLTAPDCLRHRGLDAEDLIRMLKELGLAALADKGGVSEEERRDMLGHFEGRCHVPQYGESCEWCDKIRLLILGNQGGAVTKELIYRIAGELSTQDYIPMGLGHPEKIALFLLGKFREAGAAGKEKKDETKG